MILGVSSFNLIKVNYFSITTLTGFNLSNHSGGFIEKCEDPEYQLIKEILIEHTKKRGMHLWRAIEAQEEIMQKTGLTHSELSKKLTNMSIKLFLQNPDLYLKSALKSYISFWGAGNVWHTTNIKLNYIRNTFKFLWVPQKYFYILVNLIFILSVIFLFIKKKSFIIVKNPILFLMVIIVIFASILQALVERGENTRYKLPFQPLILIFVVKIIYDTLLNRIINNTSIIKSYFKVIKEI